MRKGLVVLDNAIERALREVNIKVDVPIVKG